MQKIILVVREVGKVTKEFSLEFELPAVPEIGSYISISDPDTGEQFGSDLIVRHVWWRLWHNETRGLTRVSRAR